MVDNNKSLLHCVKKLQLAEVSILLKNGADPNYIDIEEGVSPMHIAAGHGLESLCLLLKYYGDPNIRVDDGTTPVHVSAIWGVPDCMQILLANGGDPYLTDQDGMSAVDFAYKYHHDDVILVLKQYKYDLNLEEEQTITPKYTFKRLSSDIINTQPTQLRFENYSKRYDESPSDQLEESDTDSGHLVLRHLKQSIHPSTEIRKDLQQFSCRRRSSVYLQSIQKQLDRFITSGKRTHLVDVTSPDHPYIDVRGSFDDNVVERVESDTLSGDVERVESDTLSGDDSLCLHLSTSTIDDQSSDSYVTCNGEDIDVQGSLSPCMSSPDWSPLHENIDTVKKNPKYFEEPKLVNSKTESRFSDANSDNDSDQNSTASKVKPTQNGLNRSRKYCRRILEPPVLTQDLYKTDSSCYGDNYSQVNDETFGEKCDFCGGIAEANVEDGTVCRTCEELGLELDRLVGESQESQTITVDKSRCYAASAHRKSNIGKNLTNKSRSKHLSDFNDSEPKYINKLADKLERTQLDKGVGSHYIHDGVPIKKADPVDRIVSNTQSSAMRCLDTQSSATRCLDTQSSAMRCLDTQSSATRCLDGSTRLDDTIMSSISSTVNELDKGCLWNDSILTIDDMFTDKDRISPQHKPSYSVNVQNDEKINSVALKLYNEEHGITSDPEHVSSQGYDELWTQVEACKHRRLAHRDRRAVLDTAFCGRESMSSIFSDGSTIDYVYTDKENGITLVERHIPSVCGSQGSRRSVDSQFSLNTDVDSVVNGRESDSSQDTVLYNWRDNAMVMSRDSGRGDSSQTGSQSTTTSSQTGTLPLSQDLLKLDNVEIRRRLSSHGDIPGPITTTTRQCYLKRLDQYDNDPNYKGLTLTHKSPEYPLELRQALAGNVDLTDMPALELKMVAAFQNPDRHRRWREGTLKSSFNYILLDPRITKNLPNRSCNMSDQEVFQTFITAIFYIGKGKRARPYSHLYEAIKLQQKKVEKVSKKVEKILDIWNSGLGVVSLHCFQSVIPVEAYTREACLVDAIGLHHLTNMKRGDYYGISVTFSMKERRKMGVYLLKKALQIFLAEGERQIAPLDIKKD